LSFLESPSIVQGTKALQVRSFQSERACGTDKTTLNDPFVAIRITRWRVRYATTTPNKGYRENCFIKTRLCITTLFFSFCEVTVVI